MPYRRKRRNRNKYFGVLCFVTVLWMMGGRVHLEKILGPEKPDYIKILTRDGKIYRGTKTYESSDALSLLTQGQRLTFVTGEIIGKERLQGLELKRAIELGEIKVKPEPHLVTFRMEDNFFHAALSQMTFPSARKTAAGGLPAMAAKAMGVPESKIKKAMQDPEALKKKLSPEQVAKYTRMAREKGLSV